MLAAHQPVSRVQGGMRRTALHWACQRSDIRCVEALTEAGAGTTVRACVTQGRLRAVSRIQRHTAATTIRFTL